MRRDLAKAEIERASRERCLVPSTLPHSRKESFQVASEKACRSTMQIEAVRQMVEADARAGSLRPHRRWYPQGRWGERCELGAEAQCARGAAHTG